MIKEKRDEIFNAAVQIAAQVFPESNLPKKFIAESCVELAIEISKQVDKQVGKSSK